jgi:integrase
MLEKFTTKQVENLKKTGRHGDGGGLWLQVRPAKTRAKAGDDPTAKAKAPPVNKSWLFRYYFGERPNKNVGEPPVKIPRGMGLGPFPDVGLAEARDLAKAARALVRAGKDPIQHRRDLAKARAAEAASVKTFETVADEYIAANRAGWKNVKHGKQWRATLERYVFPIIGADPVSKVETDEVLKCLRPIWEKKPETASRVRGRIESVLDFAKSRGWRLGENPAKWQGHLQHQLPARAKLARVEHHAALKDRDDLPPIMNNLAMASGMSALCLRFITLTASRSGEARGARWSEIDLSHKIKITVKIKNKEVAKTIPCPVWVLPAERMKSGKEHWVPLSDTAIEILKTLLPLKCGEDALIFPGGRKDRPLSDVAVSKALVSAAKGVTEEPLTVHGMRSVFRVWCSEDKSKKFSHAAAELSLAHANRDKTVAAYARSDLLEERQQLMAEWAKVCINPRPAGEVVQFPRKRA